MLGTFVIGLREGLEAALVVGILAAFLKRNGASLRPMWFGVAAGVLLSIVVGVTLELVAVSLPQRAQEGMEAVISAVAVVFVTGMLLWMSTHSRSMKKEIEASAGDALHRGTTWALVGMAFLAILREGFETAVFLLAAFQASVSPLAAVGGAVLGIAVAVGLGVGLYHGGVHLNLGKFFRVTGIFLVLVAAGLVLTTLRKAAEAGWLTVGQARTLDLSWLVPVGSVRAAIISGVLGMPADPRVVELLGWFLYAVPVMLLLLWPSSRRLAGRAAVRLEVALAGGLAVVALVLALAVPTPSTSVGPHGVPLVAPGSSAGEGSGGATVGTAALTDGGTRLRVAPAVGSGTQSGSGTQEEAESVSLDGAPRSVASHAGLETVQTVVPDDATSGLPATVTLVQLTAWSGGRLPTGINPATAPGPYSARWTVARRTTVWTARDGGALVDTSREATVALTLTGGGLTGPRTVGVDADATATLDPTLTPWTADPAVVAATAAAVGSAQKAAHERQLWNRYLPAVLALAAVGLLAAAVRRRRALDGDVTTPRTTPAPDALETAPPVTPPESSARAATPAAAVTAPGPSHRTRSTTDARTTDRAPA